MNSIIKHFSIKYSIPEKDYQRIPKEGPFIIASNHPLTIIDGVVLLKTILEIRPDFKLMANYLLEKCTPLKPHLISVNPFDNNISGRSSLIRI